MRTSAGSHTNTITSQETVNSPPVKDFEKLFALIMSQNCVCPCEEADRPEYLFPLFPIILSLFEEKNKLVNLLEEEWKVTSFICDLCKMEKFKSHQIDTFPPIIIIQIKRLQDGGVIRSSIQFEETLYIHHRLRLTFSSG
jgi:hypothetical protein